MPQYSSYYAGASMGCAEMGYNCSIFAAPRFMWPAEKKALVQSNKLYAKWKVKGFKCVLFGLHKSGTARYALSSSFHQKLRAIDHK